MLWGGAEQVRPRGTEMLGRGCAERTRERNAGEGLQILGEGRSRWAPGLHVTTQLQAPIGSGPEGGRKAVEVPKHRSTPDPWPIPIDQRAHTTRT
jgi:hypothetical protein